MQTMTWYCDSCGGEITDELGSLVLWEFDRNNAKSGFEIVHKGKKCDPGHKALSMEVAYFTGSDGMARLLSFLSYGPVTHREGQPKIADMDEFVDLFRRLQLPGYEEARRHFALPEVVEAFANSPEEAAYLADSLAWIAQTGRTAAAN